MFQDTWHKEIFLHYLRLKEGSYDESGFLDQSFGAVLATLHELSASLSKLNLYGPAWLSYVKTCVKMEDPSPPPEAKLPSTPSSSQRARLTAAWTFETAGHHQARPSWASNSTRSRSGSQPSHSSPSGPSTSPHISTERPAEALTVDDSVSASPYIYPIRSRPAEPRRPSYEAQLSGIPEEPYGTHRRGSTGVLSPIAIHLRHRAALRKDTR